MGLGEILQGVLQVGLSKPQKNEYIVVDPWGRPHEVASVHSDEAVREVCKKNGFSAKLCKGVIKKN